MSERISKSIIASSGNKQTSTTKLNEGVVVDVILDESHPRIKNKNDLQTWITDKDTTKVGHVVVRKYSDKTSPIERLSTYGPLNPYEMDIPLVGETVELVKIGSVYYYKRIPGNFLNKGAAGENRAQLIYPDRDASYNQKDYAAASKTSTPIGNQASSDVVTKLGSYFKTESINKLKLHEGDKLIQSRFGQSIRFSGYNNSNNVFSPTIILRNRQNAELQVQEGDIIEEDVNKDGSVIVLSSSEYQIPFIATTSISPTKFSTYPNQLKGDDHLLINSGKIIISSKTGEMIFHSKADYGFISDGKFSIDGGLGADLDFGGDVNITTNRSNSNISLNSGSGKILLNTSTSGQSPNTSQTEPLVRGNTLKQILETMIDLINSQVYRTPSGPTAVGPENRAQFNSLKRKLAEMLSTLNYTE